ncbi:U3 small nucleolar ribonucleoprotein protein MPP10-like [Zingiber officinale]|uniref:U3 small nucleolar ribonucleoprotein protein MPP10-like n=1 Tax=Zingiber officinale TaxID=94328 RepID=UPI001C4B321B|nr:U3 small nucleolar ribonucleoprotein protein MPP10-like [Zingiber officinale]
METFLKTQFDTWMIIKIGLQLPSDEDGKSTPYEKWEPTIIKKVEAYAKATCTLQCGLTKEELNRGHFDDVERAPILPSKPPKETKEMDENKSKKGLAEIYEEEYAHKTGLAPTLLSASDKLKIEATMLLKKISLKLDALSHFHFAPKPVIEDMSIQVNVPALAMEEVAPLAVSDAVMLAPEESFHEKGNIKEEAELTKEERKRRRANQKRRFR